MERCGLASFKEGGVKLKGSVQVKQEDFPTFEINCDDFLQPLN